MAEPAYHSETIELPSKGLFYDPSGPLASGKIDLYYLTAYHEDILTSSNLIAKGTVIDKLLEALIVNKSIKYGDLLLGDKNAIMIAARILGYGKNYDTTIECSNCGTKTEKTIDLTSFDDKEVKAPQTPGTNSFKFTLPLSKKVLTFKLLTHDDEQKISLELDGMKKVDKSEVQHDLTTRLKHIITAVDNDASTEVIRNFVDKDFLARDASAFRKFYASVNPDLDLSFDFVCPKCNMKRSMAVPIGLSFFWPDATV